MSDASSQQTTTPTRMIALEDGHFIDACQVQSIHTDTGKYNLTWSIVFSMYNKQQHFLRVHLDDRDMTAENKQKIDARALTFAAKIEVAKQHCPYTAAGIPY